MSNLNTCTKVVKYGYKCSLMTHLYTSEANNLFYTDTGLHLFGKNNEYRQMTGIIGSSEIIGAVGNQRNSK